MPIDLEHVLRLTEQLLSIPSPTGNERRIADFAATRVQATDPHAFVRSGYSLCWVPRPPREGARTVMLVGHLDTVPELGENPVRRDGDRLHGLGASDMKAACAVILEVLARCTQEEPRHDVIGVLYAKEEGPFAESEMPQIREVGHEWFDRADFAVCMEPTDNRIELGCLGTLHARVTFEGRRAHSARPWQGENAIHKAAGLLARLRGRGPVEHVEHGLTFFEVASATMCEYRGARNVVPDRFVLNVNYRFAPGKDEAAVRKDLDALVAGEATYEIVDFCPAGRVCGDNALLSELRDAAGKPDVAAKQAWTDVGRLSHWGIDAVNFGPGATAQAHQALEWVSIAAIERSLRALERWLFE